jgi:hypothetical protein
VTRLQNSVRKNADAGIYNQESGRGTIYPGIVIETAFSDTQTKARRDIALWINNSNVEVIPPKILY